LEPFLPNLKEELFPPVPVEEMVKPVPEPVAEIAGEADVEVVGAESSEARNETTQPVEAEA
jgi:hypothetical protein